MDVGRTWTVTRSAKGSATARKEPAEWQVRRIVIFGQSDVEVTAHISISTHFNHTTTARPLS